jgi:type IV secretion system protein VirD4
MTILAFISPVIVSLLGFWLLGLIGDPEQPKPPPALLTPNPQGFVFGEYRRPWRKPQYYCKSEQTDGHVLIAGPSGTQKSKSLVIPSLLSWQSSLFAIDVKGELSRATAHKPRQRKVFNPMDPDAWGCDPYDWLRGSNNPAQDAREIAQSLVPVSPEGKDKFWQKAAQNMLMGFMLHYCHEEASFIDTMIHIVGKPVEAHIKYLYEFTQSEVARRFLNGFIGAEPKRLADLYTEIANNIMVFATDKDIQRAFGSDKNISPQDLEAGCDIYLNIPEDKLDQWSVPFNLIVRKFITHFERRSDEQAHPILFVLDEFPRLGRVEGITAALATLRSKKITIALIIQSPAQLEMIYGYATARVIMDNCVYKAILGACDADSQETFSRLMGTQSVEQQGVSTNYAPNREEERGHTVSSHAVDQRIIQPHKYATLKDVVLLTPLGNFRAGKIRPVVC